jgi:CBS domain-containing protein
MDAFMSDSSTATPSGPTEAKTSQVRLQQESPRPQNTRAIMSFLREHSPFSHMDDAHLAHFAEHASLRFYADGDIVLSPDDGPVTRFNVVKQGRIVGERLRDSDAEPEITFEISIGECFPLAALIGERPTRTLHRASGDTFCLSIENDAFIVLLSESDPFRDFCIRGVSSLLEQVNQNIQSKAMVSMGSGSSLDTPLERYALRNPIVCSPDLPVRKAVARMHDNSVGSIVITDDTRIPKGIFTLRDLRTLVADERAPLDTPIGQVMTPDPCCLTGQADAFEAAMKMAEHHFSHVCVVDDEGHLIGMVSERDLFSLQRVDLVNLARTIGTANQLRTLVDLRADVSRLVDAMLAHGADSGQVVKIITTLNDVTVRRVLELNLMKHDPGIPFTWLTFGSEGRQEQTLLTDQDNGILFVTPEGMTEDQAREKLLPFADRVTKELAECGFTLCKGNIMASNPKLCLSGDEWDEWFLRFIDASTPQNLVYSSIFLDMRAVFGDREPLEKLLDQVLARIRKNDLFQKMLAGNAVSRRPPLTMFRGFRYAQDGDRHSLDLKRQGLAPFVEAARVFALANGVRDANTLERMNQLARTGVFDPKDAQAWKEAYSLIQAIRMRAHQEQLNRNEALSNYINPDDLNPLDRRILRESFRQAQRLQQKLEVTYQL